MIRLLLISLILLSNHAFAAEIADLPEEILKHVKLLEEGSDKERKAAAKALYKMKEKASPALPWLTKHLEIEKNVWVKKEIRKAIKRIGPDEKKETTKNSDKATSKPGAKDADGYIIPLPSPHKNKLRIVYSPDGIGKNGGSASKAKVEIREIPGLKASNKYMLIHLTGKEWSGKILNWADFWGQSPTKIMPNQYTHIVLRCLYLGRPGDVNLTISIQTEGGAQSDFLRLATYDPKHQLQKSKSFVDIAIPIKDFHASLSEEDRKKAIWGVHIGTTTGDKEKDMGLLLKHIAVYKMK